LLRSIQRSAVSNQPEQVRRRFSLINADQKKAYTQINAKDANLFLISDSCSFAKFAADFVSANVRLTGLANSNPIAFLAGFSVPTSKQLSRENPCRMGVAIRIDKKAAQNQPSVT